MAHFHSVSIQSLSLLKELLPDGELATHAISLLGQGNTDIDEVVANLQGDLDDPTALARVELVLQIFWACSENITSAQLVLSSGEHKSIRDVALQCMALRLKLPEPAQKEFIKRVYDLDSTGCIINALGTNAFKDVDVAPDALKLLESNPYFDIERDSVFSLGVPENVDNATLEFLKTLQRLQAVVISAAELRALWFSGYRSAVQISTTEESKFVSDMGDYDIDADVAQSIRRAADAVKARNEHLLLMQAQSNLSSQISIPVLNSATTGVSLSSFSQGTSAPPEDSTVIQAAHQVTARQAVEVPSATMNPVNLTASAAEAINLDTLFGDTLTVAVDENYSVTSPAAYFVDLMRFLQMTPIAPGTKFDSARQSPPEPNALQALSARRPDLENLHLSKENTRVSLPYIDLANEVLEACAAFQHQSDLGQSTSSKPSLAAFNVSPDDQSTELIEAPRNVSLSATKALSNNIGVNLPYDYDGDRLKESFRLLGISWESFVDSFRDDSISPFFGAGATKESLAAAQKTAIDRSLVASYLGIRELDFAYMTSERFWPATDATGGLTIIKEIPGQNHVWGYADPSSSMPLSIRTPILVKPFSASLGVSVDDLIGLIDSPYINSAKFDLSQVQLDFLELIGPLIPFLQGKSDQEAIAIMAGHNAITSFFTSNELDSTKQASFVREWLADVMPQVSNTVIVDMPSSSEGALDLNNMTLGLLSGDKQLTPTHLQKIWTVCKLGKSLGLPLGQVSAALHTSARLCRVSWSSPPTADVLCQLSFMVRLAEHLSVPIDQLGDLWTSFTGTAAGSNFASVFLRHELVKGGQVRYLFSPDASGTLRFENSAAPISSHLSEISAAFRTTVADLETLVDALSTTLPVPVLQSSAKVPAVLNLANLSTLYRWSTLQSFLSMDARGFSKFVALYPTSLVDAKSAFESITAWHKLAESGLDINEAYAAVNQGFDDSEDAASTIDDGIRMIFELRQSWAEIKSRLPDPRKDSQVTDEEVTKATLSLYNTTTTQSILAFLNGSYFYVDKTVQSPRLVFVVKDDPVEGDGETDGKQVSEGEEGGDDSEEAGDDNDSTALVKPSWISSKIIYQAVEKSQFLVRISGLLSDEEAAGALEAVDTKKTDTVSWQQWRDAVHAAKVTSQTAADVFDTLIPRAQGFGSRREFLRNILLSPDAPPRADKPASGDSTTVSLQTQDSVSPDEKRREYMAYFAPIARQYLIHKAINDAVHALLSGVFTPPALEYLFHNVHLGDPSNNPIGLGTIADKLAHAVSPDIKLVDLESPPAPPVTSSTAASSEADLAGQVEGDLAANDQTVYLYVPTAGTYTLSLSHDPLRNRTALGSGETIEFGDKKISFGADLNSPPLTLVQGQICAIKGRSSTLDSLDWQSGRTVKTAVPFSSLLSEADFSFCVTPALRALSILSRWLTKYSLSLDEIIYVVSTLLEGVRLFTKDGNSALDVRRLNQLNTYYESRAMVASLSKKRKSTLLELLQWISAERRQVSDLEIKMAKKLEESYGWPQETCSWLLTVNVFGGVNNSVDLMAQVRLLLDQISFMQRLGVLDKPDSARTLCVLAAPVPYTMINGKVLDASQLSTPVNISERETAVSSIVVLAAARSTADSRQKMHNRLRERRRDALVDYLVQRSYFREKGIVDADGLFEHLLIDSQINSPMLTSRLKQAISTIQLFVQRCLLGLEAANGVPSSAFDAKLWEWMQKYTLWQANREVFLYPENWLDPALRPLKSTQYQKFETSLTAKDVSQVSLDGAVREYVMSVVDIGNLEPVSLYWETRRVDGLGRPSGRIPDVLHIFARTRHKPWAFYYRTRDCRTTHYFSPWEKVELDIPVYETDASGQALSVPGVYMIPHRVGGRLFLIIPQFTVSISPAGSTSIKQDEKTKEWTGTSGSTSNKSWSLQFAMSEYVNGKWTPKQVFKDVIPSNPQVDQLRKFPVFGEWAGPDYQQDPVQSASHEDCYKPYFRPGNPPALDKYRFWPYQSSPSDENALNIDISWHCPCLKEDRHKGKGGHRCIVAQTVIRCGRLQPVSAELKTAYESGSALPAFSQREVWDTAFSKVVRQYYVPGLRWDRLPSPQYLDQHPRASPVDLGSHALFSFQDQLVWNDSAPVVYVTEPTATNIGLASALNFDARVAPEWKTEEAAKGTNGTVLRIPLVYVQGAALASKANAGMDSVYEYLHGLKANRYLRFTTSGELNYCDDSSLAFGPKGMELMAPYSQYNAEIGVHMPMAMMTRFAASQQFDAALAAGRLIFNPLEQGMATRRCWKWPPFSSADVVNDVQRVLDKKTDLWGVVAAWRENPFSPFVIARSRPSTYMKWVVAKYIEVLVAYGDSYFRQNTLESIPYALNMYVQAAKLFGPAPQSMRDPGQPRRSATFKGLAARLDAFSLALVDMEVQFPFVVRNAAGSQPPALPNNNATDMARNVLLAASTRYFGLPANPRLARLRDLIDDRLYKIRNYLDINGHAQVLPLFDPPLDPGALVAGVANGVKISQLSNDIGTTMPNYRFPYLLAKALELCGELKQLSSAFLAAKQNGDGEQMSLLRTQQEASIHEAVLQLKKLQLDEAKESLESLRESRRGPVMRLRHYLALIGEPSSRIPGPGADFSEIDAQIEAPTKDSLRMSPLERREMNEYELSSMWKMLGSSYSMAASIAALIPDMEENVMPFGGGVTIKAGPKMIETCFNLLAQYYGFLSEVNSTEAAKAGREAGLTRQAQDRRLQANVAGREIKAIDRQIVVQQKRLEAAALEIETQNMQMEHTARTLEFLRDKYTSVQLFSWMEAAVRSSLYDTYTLAYDIAKRAEMAFSFERGGDATTSFIKPGYWDAAHDGQLCGDGLYLSLKRLEAAYMEKRGHDYELTRHISLRGLSPLGLLSLRRTGAVEFSLPEQLFDMDFPGHYRRRIKSVALSIPCVVGPYTGINCTLRLLSHRYRYTAAQATTARDYPEATSAASDPRFRTDLVPISAIAVSSAQNDAGVFELGFSGERYLPFEGAGAVSSWRLELPGDVRLFDYESIADVVLHVRYTASDGGERLKKAAAAALASWMTKIGGGGGGGTGEEAPLVALLDLKNDFPSEWRRFSAAGAAPGTRKMVLDDVRAHLPFYAKSMGTRRPVAKQVMLVPEGDVEGLGLKLQGKRFDLENVVDVAGGGKAYRLQGGKGLEIRMDDGGWTLEGDVGEDGVGRMWLLVGYLLK